MQDSIPVIHSSFHANDQQYDPTTLAAAATKSGQSIVASVYRTKIAGHCRLITVSWCRDVLAHGFSVSFEQSTDNASDDQTSNSIKVDLRPWYFWRKHGSKRLEFEGSPVGVFWDLRTAKFCGEPEPRSSYYVAVICDDEVVLMLGDNKKEAFRKTGCRPSMIDAALVSRKEHVFGKRKFTTRAKFHEKGRMHEISIECNSSNGSTIGGNVDAEMVIKIDGCVVIDVKHLQWKFRGNESINVSKAKVEVYWDVHDWIFSPGLRHALFIFKPLMNLSSASMSSTSTTNSMTSFDGASANQAVTSAGLSEFSLFLYAWKLE